MTLEEMVHELARLPLAYQPGTRWHYSLGIDVAARLIEVISGRSLIHFLKEEMFGPLGMTDTGFHVPPEKRDRLAIMYVVSDAPDGSEGGLLETWESGLNDRIDVSGYYPASEPDGFARGGHGLFSTASDYMRFAQMLLNAGELDGARILGRKTVELMHVNHLPADLLPIETAPGVAFKGYGWGLGCRVLMDVAGSEMPGSAGEFGWGGGAKTHYWVDPEEQIVGVLMSQHMASTAEPQKDLQVLTYQAVVD